MKEPDLEEEDLRASIIEGRLEISRRSLSDKPVTVEVTLPSGKKAEVKLADQGDGRQTGSLPVTETGLYRLTDGTHLAFAASGALNPLEIADLRSTPEKMQPLVNASGGRIFRLAGGRLPEIRMVGPGRQHRRLQLDGADRRRRLHRHRHPPDVPAAGAGWSDPRPRRPDVRLAARGALGSERLLEIGQELVGGLDARRQAQQVARHRCARTLDRGAMLDQTLDPAEGRRPLP